MASTTSFKQQCPSCEAMVPIRDPNLIGRKIDCPKCKYRFVVEKPKGKARGDDEDAGDETPAPAKKAKKVAGGATSDTRVPAKKGLKPGVVGKASDKGAAGKPKAKPSRPLEEDDEEDDRPKKKKKQGGVSTTVLIGAGIGGLALVLVVIGVLGFALHWFGGGDSTPSNDPNNNASNNKPGGSTGAPQQAGNPGGTPNKPGPNGNGNNPPPGRAFISDVTNLLPNDADTVIHYQIDKLHNSGLGQSALEPGRFSEKAFADIFGFPLFAANDGGVERVLTAINNSNNWVFTVLHTQKGLILDRDKLVANLALDAHDPVNGLIVYSVRRDLDALSNLLIKANRPHEELQMVMLDGQTLVFADPAPMQKFLADVKQFKGHPNYLTQPTLVAPANSGGGPNPGGSTPPGGSSGGPGGSVPPMPGASGPGGSSGSPGGGVQPITPPGGSSGGSAPPGGSSGGPGGSVPPMPGSSGGPGGSGPGPQQQPKEVGSYLTVNPDIKAVFDRIEQSDPSVLVSAVTSSKDPLAEQLSRFVQGRAASWATAQDVGSDDQTKSALDMLKAFRPQDENACWVGVALTACSQDKLSGVVVVNMGTPDLAKGVYTEMQAFVTIGNLLLTGAGSPANPGGSNPNPGGSVPPMPNGPGGSVPPMPNGPGGSVPPMPNGPGGSVPPMPNGPGGSIPPMPNGSGGGFNPGGTNPPAPQGPPSLTLSQDKALIQLNASLLFVGEKNKKRADQEIGQLLTRLKVGAETASSRSRIHELAAALQRYVQKNGHFPRGTVKRDLTSVRVVEWAPDQRVSWLADLLPYLGESELANLPVDGAHASWNEGNNLRFASVMIPQYISHADPSAPVLIHYPGVPLDVAVTNYIGVAGTGLDAADYAPGNPKDGVFGYDRETKPDDIKDGADKTIAVLQMPAGKTPWMAGGGATVRGVSEAPDALQPYVCAVGPDGRRGTFAIMADFRVRFIPENIDPAKFTAMCTIAGNEKLDDIDTIAPVVPDDNPTLKAGGPGGGPQAPPAPPPPDKPDAAKGDAPQGWIEYASKDGGFSVKFPPLKVREDTKAVNLPGVGQITLTGAGVELPNESGVYMAMYNDYPAAVLTRGADPVLDGARAGVVASLPGGKLISESAVALDGNPGRAFVVDVPGQGKANYRLYLVKNRLYQLMAAGTPEKVSDKDMQAFLDSFKLAAQAPPPADKPAPPGDKPAAKTDPPAGLDGTWYVVTMTVGGQRNADVPDQFVIAGNKLQQKVFGAPTAEAATQFPGPTPDLIDLSWQSGKQRGTRQSGILKLDGDSLQICYGTQRPTTFESPSGSDLTSVTLKRKK